MGGSALSFQTDRLHKEAYFALTNLISERLTDVGIIHKLVEAYHLKESFGDADFVLQSESLNNTKLKDLINSLFNCREIVQNSNIYSFDITSCNFQIDFVLHSKEIFDIANCYYKFSPAGNSLGKLYHQFKLRLGHEGLFYTLREEDCGGERQDNSHVMENVILCRDWKEICEFINLDYNRWAAGFETEEDIFEWVCSCPFFNSERFSFEEMNHRARTRDRKRPDYNRLMHWIVNNKHRLPHYQRNHNKVEYLPWIFERFPILEERIEFNKQRYAEYQVIKSKFNGNIVTELTGLTNANLGKFLATFKKGKENFNDWVLTNTTDQIKLAIKEHYDIGIY